MGKIAVEGMKFSGFHGVSSEERVVPSRYVIDVYVTTDFSAAGKNGDLANTINYESIFMITGLEVSKPVNLLETLAMRIINSLKEMFPQVETVSTKIMKLHPPLEENIEYAFVEADQTGIMKVGLKGLRLYRFHGFYEEERAVGNYYTIDITGTINGNNAAKTDDFTQTISYESLFHISRFEMSKPTLLLEEITQRIMESCKAQFPKLIGLTVKLIKEQPPIENNMLGRAYIELTESFLNVCPRCKEPIHCYKNSQCWCNNLTIFPATKALIASQFKGACLCEKCLKFYGAIEK